MPTAYTNGKIFTGDFFDEGKAVLTDMGIITDIVTESDIPGGYTRHDLQGMNLAPGLIDLQIYGGNDKMFSDDPGMTSLDAIYQYCLGGGATHFMVTMATNSIELFLQGIEAVRAYWQAGGKGLLGLHLEGPYINPVKKGAHLKKHIKPPTMDEVKMLLDKGSDVIKMITIAPEVCSEEVITTLLDNISIVSAGHSNASYTQAQQAFGSGIPAATHLYNAMSGLQHREPGMVGAIFNDGSVKSSIVCDGIHVDYAAVRIAKKVMQDRLFYITDAVCASKKGDYPHVYAGDRYTLPDGTLSGSALTMMQCVKNGIEKAGMVPEESLRMAGQYPGSLLCNEIKIGEISEQFAADFVVFDDEYKIVEMISTS
jgi:N-acetylglucosamine-6-phosphate deacetylase